MRLPTEHNQNNVWLSRETLIACLLFVPQWVDGFMIPKWLAFVLLTLDLLWYQRQHLRLSWVHLLLPLMLLMHFKLNYTGLGEAMMLLGLGLASCLHPLPEALQQQFRAGLATAGYLVIAYLLLQTAGLDPWSWHKNPPAGSFMGNPNFAGHFLLLVLCFARRPQGRMGWLFYLPLIAAILLTGSRACYVGLVIYGLGHEAIAKRWRPAIWTGLLVTLLGLTVYFRADLRMARTYISHPDVWVAAFVEQPDEADLRDPWFQGKRKSIMTRVLLWQNSLKLIMAEPMGVGMGRFEAEYAAVAAGHDVNLSHHYRPRYAHNLVLDLAARFGIPFSIVCLVIGLVIYREEDRHYRLGLIIQAIIAMVSLNYISAPVVMSLCLLRRSSTGFSWTSSRGTTLLCCLGVSAVIALGGLAYLKNRAAPPPKWICDVLFPDKNALDAYAAGDLEQAWHYQLDALEADPFGPEIHYNLAMIALARSGPSPLTMHLLYVLEERHPFYGPTFEMIETLKQRHDALPDREACAEQFGNGMPDESFLRNWQPK